MKLLNKLFVRYDWNILCERKAKDGKIYSITLKSSNRYWYADPFPFSYNDIDVVFFEMYDQFTGKGCIACSKIENNKFLKPKIVIKEKFHMSYPNVFIKNGTIYMIPETSRGNELILYKCLNFPYEWIKEKILLSNVKFVDTSFFVQDDILLTYDVSKTPFLLKKIAIDWNNLVIDSIEDVLIDNNQQYRPAGNYFSSINCFLGQKNDCYYGEYINFYIVEKNLRLNKNNNLKVEQLFNNSIPSNIGIHTFNEFNNLKVCDYLVRRIVVYKLFYKLVRTFSK